MAQDRGPRAPRGKAHQDARAQEVPPLQCLVWGRKRMPAMQAFALQDVPTSAAQAHRGGAGREPQETGGYDQGTGRECAHHPRLGPHAKEGRPQATGQNRRPRSVLQEASSTYSEDMLRMRKDFRRDDQDLRKLPTYSLHGLPSRPVSCILCHDPTPNQPRVYFNTSIQAEKGQIPIRVPWRCPER